MRALWHAWLGRAHDRAGAGLWGAEDWPCCSVTRGGADKGPWAGWGEPQGAGQAGLGVPAGP